MGYRKEMFNDAKDPRARQHRDLMAQQLRAEGWSVECSKVNFTDLARCSVYILEARKDGKAET